MSAEETAWENGGRSLWLNPILKGFAYDVMSVEDGTADPESGLGTYEDVVIRWIDYLADGDQELSQHPTILAQANEYFRVVAETAGLEYRPGMVAA